MGAIRCGEDNQKGMTMKLFGYKPSQIRKFVVAVLGAVVLILTQILTTGADVIPASWGAWISTVVAVATAAGVYLARNASMIDSLDE